MQNNDLVFRKAAIAEIEEYLQGLDSCISPDLKLDGYKNGLQVAIHALNELSAVDAVPVVRCKECKYAHLNDDDQCKWCDRISALTDEGDPIMYQYFPPDWYCAYGEREDDV